MLKAYKYCLYPNKEQQEYFAKCFGCVRFIYNRMLSDKIEYYKETKQKLREDTSNRRWINNGIIEKYVCKEQLDSFLENDWSKGRIYRRKNKND